MTTTAAPVPVSMDCYRDLMGAFPTGVAVITAVDRVGRPHGLTCTSLTSVTLAPPTLLVSLSVGSGTGMAVQQGGGFAVNLLHARARAAAAVFGSPTPDRFSQVAWRRSPRTGQPWLSQDAFAMAECVVVNTMLVADHEVVFGQVVHVEQTVDAPLLYGLRRFCRWPVTPPAAAVAVVAR